MNTLVLSTDSQWVNHWQGRATVCQTTVGALAYLESGNYTRILIDFGLLTCTVIEWARQAGTQIVVVSSAESAAEARLVKMAGAEYAVKDFGMDDGINQGLSQTQQCH